MSIPVERAVDVVVIGGGAAGLMAAAVAGQRGRHTVLLEHSEKVGKKIRISGGGRCNFTNLNAQPENYLSENPDFCRSALARYTPQDFVQLVEKHGIAYHEKKLGQQFCDTTADEIIQMLVEECREVQAEIVTGCQVSAIRRPGRFVIESNQGSWETEALIIATGGLSFPKLGATDFGYRLAEQFGLAVTTLRPGLVPLTFRPEDLAQWAELTGVAFPVTIHNRGQNFTENLLITHRGTSGPAILQISSYWREGDEVQINLLPEIDVRDWLQQLRRTGATMASALGRELPHRFVQYWCRGRASDRPVAQWSGAELKTIEEELTRWRLKFGGTEGYARAEVTLGGISTRELSSKTMEAKKVPGLFFIGEVVDVTGWLGGYNFQWAWASAQAAGQAA
jgi:predicted Rossmann fold flavoprotein